MRDLLYAALVQSDNIAAYALAEHVGRALQAQLPPSGEAARGTPVDYFVLQMNALAKHLGMERTRFLNPSGADANEKPYSTAADIARLTRYAMKNAGFRFYVSQKEREIEFGRGPGRLRYLLRNTNELLGRENIDGVKTGRTQRAGGGEVGGDRSTGHQDARHSAPFDCGGSGQLGSLWRRSGSPRARLVALRSLGGGGATARSKRNAGRA